MKICFITRLGCIKSLMILYLALQLSACGKTQEDGQDAVGLNQGSVLVKWVAPSTRSNGDPISLSEIEGFRVYYGLQQGVYPNEIIINDGTAQQVTISDKRGFYYFVLTTIDVDGRESEYSQVLQVTI